MPVFYDIHSMHTGWAASLIISTAFFSSYRHIYLPVWTTPANSLILPSMDLP